MARHSILIARFPYGGFEYHKCTDWLVKTVIEMKSDPRIDDIHHVALNDTPITMTRNKACRLAQLKGVDFILMIDNDMVPDYQYTQPFWGSSFDFMLAQPRPCMIAAPYCGPPPVENVYIFRWRTNQSHHNNPDYSLAQYTREEAAQMAGIEEVAALPTGLLLMHTAVLGYIPTPWFDYNYTDEYELEKDTTEDVYFTRNCSLSGIPVYCNWDSWAGHVKPKIVPKPTILTADIFAKQAQRAVREGKDSHEVMMELRPPQGARTPCLNKRSPN